MAEAMQQKFHQYQSASAPKAEVEALLQRHHLLHHPRQIDWSPDLLACEDGIGVYFNPEEGQEMMTSVRRGAPWLAKTRERCDGGRNGGHQTIPLRRCYQSPICAQTRAGLWGRLHCRSVFDPQDCDTYYLEYLLRRYKGHFYRQRYPSLTIVDA